MLFGGAAAVLIVIVVVIVLIVKGCSGRTDALAGTWDFDGTTTYEFDGNGTGATKDKKMESFAGLEGKIKIR